MWPLGHNNRFSITANPMRLAPLILHFDFTGVWVEHSLKFQLCTVVGFYVDTPFGHSNLHVLTVGMVKSVRKKMVHCYNSYRLLLL